MRARIIGGSGKGRRLKFPKGLETRPTAGRVKQTLFDILTGEVSGAAFLDVFAGGGGVGLEALSRGARRVVLVDRSAAAVAAIRENARAMAVAEGAVWVLRREAVEALSSLAQGGQQFDVIYLDPPYASDLYEPLLQQVASGLLREGGLVAVEHFHKRVLPETIGDLVQTRSVRVGDHRLTFYRRMEQKRAT